MELEYSDRIMTGYHVEDVTERKMYGKSLLSEETLDNNKLLFLSSNTVDWYPNHLKNHQENFRVLQVDFKVPSEVVEFNEPDDYFELWRTKHVVGETYELTPLPVMDKKYKGVDFFKLNHPTDISEFF